MLTRTATIEVIWTCVNTRGQISKIHIAKAKITDTYEKENKQPILNWLTDKAEITSNEICKRSCQSLSTSLFCNEYSYTTIEGPEEIETIPKVPGYILKTIEDLEKRKDEAKTIERKDKIQITINELKRKYGIK